MRLILRRIFLWSWVLTLPLAITGGYLAFRTLDRFYTFQIRYDPEPINSTLGQSLRYEINHLIQKLRVKSTVRGIFQQTTLPSINLFISEPNLAQLGSHMPQSGFQYVRGAIFVDGELKKAKIKYRGDFSYHWRWDKKSIRVKTKKSALFEGLRVFNLQAPKTAKQLNNFLSLKLAKTLDLLAPRTEIVRHYLNGDDRGVYIFVEQPSETTLRNANLMPGDIYRGEMVGKDAFSFLGLKGGDRQWLFDSVSFWDKVAINNHYDPESFAPLEKLIELAKDHKAEQNQAALSEIMDMEA